MLVLAASVVFDHLGWPTEIEWILSSGLHYSFSYACLYLFWKSVFLSFSKAYHLHMSKACTSQTGQTGSVHIWYCKNACWVQMSSWAFHVRLGRKFITIFSFLNKELGQDSIFWNFTELQIRIWTSKYIHTHDYCSISQILSKYVSLHFISDFLISFQRKK